jgi:hypothetical protein
MTAATVAAAGVARHGRAKLYCSETDLHPIYPNFVHRISILDQDEKFVIGPVVVMMKMMIMMVALVVVTDGLVSFSFSIASTWSSSVPTGPCHTRQCNF